MIIPKYVQGLMKRAKYAIGYGEPGYTLEIAKETPYAYVITLEGEINRLERWIKRVMPKNDLDVSTMVVNKIPKNTHHCNQYATVTIYDPVMNELEKYIRGEQI